MTRQSFLVCLLGALLTSTAALAGPVEEAKQLATAYAKQNNFPILSVDAGPSWRKVQRLFVPITPQTFQAFKEVFQIKNGFVHLHQNTAFANEAFMSRTPQEALLWAAPNQARYPGTMSFGVGSRLMVPALNPAHLQHMNKWIDDGKGQQIHTQIARKGNCMTWISNAEVAPGVTLFNLLGDVIRSSDGPNIKAKLIHAANERIAVVGVCVNDLAQFKAMTPKDLLGPEPAGGTDDCVRGK